MSYTDLGKATDLSTSAVHQRVKRLEQRGLITGYGATVDHDQLGRPLTAFISITPIDPSQPDDYPERLRRHPGDRVVLVGGGRRVLHPQDPRRHARATSRTCSPGSAAPPASRPGRRSCSRRPTRTARSAEPSAPRGPRHDPRLKRWIARAVRPLQRADRDKVRAPEALTGVELRAAQRWRRSPGRSSDARAGRRGFEVGPADADAEPARHLADAFLALLLAHQVVGERLARAGGGVSYLMRPSNSRNTPSVRHRKSTIAESHRQPRRGPRPGARATGRCCG